MQRAEDWSTRGPAAHLQSRDHLCLTAAEYQLTGVTMATASRAESHSNVHITHLISSHLTAS